MRPDEHKKKKNAVYKKKHGISNKSSDNTKEKHNDGRNKAAGASENFQKSSSRPKTSTSQALSGSSSESDDEVVERKSFKRREIVSNWNKYDQEPDIADEHVKSRGEDFKKLLNMGGEAISHFRFQEELEWDDDVKSGNGDAAQRGAGENSFLALDLTDIASSISCVPLHQVLGIDQGLFPADQLEAHMKSVNENCSLYLKSKEEEKRARESESCAISKDICTSHGSGPSFKTDSDRPSHQDNRVVSGGELEKHKKNTFDKNCVKPSVVNRESTSPKVNTTSSKDSKISSPQSSNVKSIPEASVSLHLQDEGLDQLLDTADDLREDKKSESTVNKSEKVNAASSSPKKDDKKEAEELEDWLDSILD